MTLFGCIVRTDWTYLPNFVERDRRVRPRRPRQKVRVDLGRGLGLHVAAPRSSVDHVVHGEYLRMPPVSARAPVAL